MLLQEVGVEVLVEGRNHQAGEEEVAEEEHQQVGVVVGVGELREVVAVGFLVGVVPREEVGEPLPPVMLG